MSCPSDWSSFVLQKYFQNGRGSEEHAFLSEEIQSGQKSSGAESAPLELNFNPSAAKAALRKTY